MTTRGNGGYLRQELYAGVKSDERIFDFIQESALDGIWYWDLENPDYEWMSPQFWTALGYNPEEMPHKPSAWQKIINQEDLKVTLENFTRHCENPNHPYDQIVRYTHKNSTTVWMRCRGFAIRDQQGKPIRMVGTHQNVTKSVHAEIESVKLKEKAVEALQQFEWMLSGKRTESGNFPSEFGDLSELNENGLILSSVGEEQLQHIASEYLDLLETSSAVYEKNGDYAMGIFSSNWCQKMDSASRRLCNTKSNQEALHCGKWLCHESCWRDASQKAIENGKPEDVACIGGIRLYAVPIYANGEAIGAINFGYGEPPKADDKLQELSALFQIPVEELKKASQEYQIRPQFIIDYAKRRIQDSALHLGYLIERKQAEQLLLAQSKEITARNELLSQTIQELSRAKENAEESEEKYRLQFLNMNSCNSLYEVVTDKEGKPCDFRFIMVNHAYEDFVGKRHHELIGKTLLEVFPSTEPYWIDKMIEVALSGKPCRFENFSTVLNTHTEINMYVPKQGQLAMVSATITERKRAEEALRRNRDLLNATQRLTKVGGWEWDIEQQSMTWTDETYYIHGMKPGEIPLNSPEHIIISESCYNPEDRIVIDNAFRLCAREGISYDMEFPFTRVDGKQIWIRTVAEAIKDGDRIIRVAGNIQDITERKRAEEAQAEISQRLRLANKATNDVIWDWDVINDTQQWNEAGRKVFGWNEIVDHCVNANWWIDRVHPNDRDRVHASFYSVVNDTERDTWHDEYRFLKADGTYAYVLDRGYVLRDRQGKAIRMIGAMLDITDKKLNEQKLILAKEKAEESDRLKTAFLQNMSHEIRTPMNAIMGFSSLLPLNFNNKEKLESFSKIIELRSSNILDIINDLLDISKIESGQSTISLEHCDINELFDELNLFFTDYMVQIQKQNVQLVFHPAGEASLSTIQTDKVKLKQILINLISNAVKFTLTGSVSCGYIQDHTKLQFYVHDTGIGIPADKHDSVFERFFQLKHPSLKNVSGTGLGLPIVKGLVKLLGGDVWFESEPDKGSIFYFTIDYIKADSLQAEKLVTTGNQEITTDKTILIVEDDYFNAEYLKEVVSSISTNILYAANGSEAVKMAQEQKIDIILMDIRLPDITGYEATRLILRDNPGMKIIAQTAYAANVERQKALDAGCVDFISKPTKQEQLVALMEKYLKG